MSVSEIDRAERIERSESLAPEPANALAATLDLDETYAEGDALPPMWHWIYLLEQPPSRLLGPDGHPEMGIPTPPSRGMKRMFAGGRVRTNRALVIGEEAQRETFVHKEETKQGKTGPLTFVTVRTLIRQFGEVAIDEEQDIVYREASSSTARNDQASKEELPGDRESRFDTYVDEKLLFRFSALTFNSHRIHYDRAWCEYEGYDGLVIHGPLQALMMAELARRNSVPLVGSTFGFRLVAPLVGVQTMHCLAASDGLRSGAEIRGENGVRTAVATFDVSG